MEHEEEQEILFKWLKQLKPILDEMNKHWRIFKDWDSPQPQSSLEMIYNKIDEYLETDLIVNIEIKKHKDEISLIKDRLDKLEN